jgi:transposase-like protein
MSSKMLDDQSKISAVGEVLAGCGTLSSVARRHGISIGYLSILVSRARQVLESKNSAKLSQKTSAQDESISRLASRILKLEKKINSLFK